LGGRLGMRDQAVSLRRFGLMNRAFCSLALALVLSLLAFASNSAPQVVPILDSKSCCPIFPATIGGKEYRFLLDTAASDGMVSSRLVRELALQPSGVGGANDSSKNPNIAVSVYQLNGLKVGSIVFNHILVAGDPSGKDAGR